MNPKATDARWPIHDTYTYRAVVLLCRAGRAADCAQSVKHRLWASCLRAYPREAHVPPPAALRLARGDACLASERERHDRVPPPSKQHAARRRAITPAHVPRARLSGAVGADGLVPCAGGGAGGRVVEGGGGKSPTRASGGTEAGSMPAPTTAWNQASSARRDVASSHEPDESASVAIACGRRGAALGRR